MRATFRSLPDDFLELRAVSELMAAGIKTQAYRIEKLKKELATHRKVRFGSKSETMDQLAFDLQEDAEIAASAAAQRAAPETDADEDAPARRTHNRAPLPDPLERQKEILSPGDACGDCGGALEQLGEDVTGELEYVPGHFVVKRIVRPCMTCTCCEAFAQADLPSRPITRGRPGPGLLAHVPAGKHCDHLPLYRQSQIRARDQVDPHGSTLTDWVGRSTTLPEPLAAHIASGVEPVLRCLPMIRPSRCRPGARRKQRAFGAMCAMNALGAGKRRPACGISSASTGRASTPHPLSRDTKA